MVASPLIRAPLSLNPHSLPPKPVDAILYHGHVRSLVEPDGYRAHGAQVVSKCCNWSNQVGDSGNPENFSRDKPAATRYYDAERP